MPQAQPAQIPLTPRQRIFLTFLFLLALTLSYFVVSTIDPLASALRLSSTNESPENATVHPGVQAFRSTLVKNAQAQDHRPNTILNPHEQPPA